MLVLQFAGWFQCRLPTDPDPSDELRGVSGFTFAMAGEPDLDRIIRFHRPVAPRSHGPDVGVFVTGVTNNGVLQPESPLVGATVDLLGEPKFESRNYVLRDSAQGPIVPFIVRIEGGGITIEREDLLFPEDPTRPLHEVPTRSLARRGSRLPMVTDRIRIADATGIVDPIAYRARRKALLELDLQEACDPIERVALEMRIRELSITDPRRLQVATLMVYNDYRFDIRGPARLDDPQAQIGSTIDFDADWPIVFWLGAWDSDALIGHARGILSIPYSSTKVPANEVTHDD